MPILSVEIDKCLVCSQSCKSRSPLGFDPELPDDRLRHLHGEREKPWEVSIRQLKMGRHPDLAFIEALGLAEREVDGLSLNVGFWSEERIARIPSFVASVAI